MKDTKKKYIYIYKGKNKLLRVVPKGSELCSNFSIVGGNQTGKITKTLKTSLLYGHNNEKRVREREREGD